MYQYLSVKFVILLDILEAKQACAASGHVAHTAELRALV